MDRGAAFRSSCCSLEQEDDAMSLRDAMYPHSGQTTCVRGGGSWPRAGVGAAGVLGEGPGVRARRGAQRWAPPRRCAAFHPIPIRPRASDDRWFETACYLLPLTLAVCPKLVRASARLLPAKATEGRISSLPTSNTYGYL